jgi:hypothetical protein
MCKRRSSIVSAEMCAPLAQTRDVGRITAPDEKLFGSLARNRTGMQGFAVAPDGVFKPIDFWSLSKKPWENH